MDIGDIYRLSPLQQELLADLLARPRDDLDVVQLSIALSGPSSLPELEASWERAAARHGALRTRFRPTKVPLQLVPRQAKPPFAVLEPQDGLEIAAFLEEDRARGFDPAQGPLVRLAALRLAAAEHLLVLTYHRLVLDGPSAALVAGQVLAGCGGDPEPERPRPFRDYVAWLGSQDAAHSAPSPSAESFWRGELAGAVAPVDPGSPEPLPGRTGSAERTLALTPSAVAALDALARQHGLAFDTLAQGAWVLLLSRRCGSDDVLFGVTAAGRPPSLAGSAAMVGRFAGVLPLRVAVDPEAPLLPWLRRLEERRTAAAAYAHVPLSQIRKWSGSPPGAPLFHCRLAVEPSPWPRATGPAPPSDSSDRRSDLTQEPLETRWIAAFPEPLAVAVRPGAVPALQAVYDRSRLTGAEALACLAELSALLEGFAADPGRRLGEIADAASAATRDREPAESPHRLDEIARRVRRRVFAGSAGIPEMTGTGSIEAPSTDPRGRRGQEIAPVPRDGPLPASFYQEWGLDLPGIETNNLPAAFRLKGPVDLAAFRRALAEVVRRHESLRTSFRRAGGDGGDHGEARLAIAPPGEVPLPLVDLTALPETAALPGEARAATLRRLIAEHAGHAFDVWRGPLFVAQAVRLGPREHAFLVNVHHLVADGWSIQVLQRELILIYDAFAQGRPSPLPPLPIQFADYAWWQRRVFAGEGLAAQLAWWRRALAGLPPPPALPADLPRPEVVGHRSVDLALDLSPAATQSLLGLARAAQCSPPMVLFAAVAALLHAYSGEEDLVASLISAGRSRPELEGQIGLYMNTLPLRVDLAGDPPFRRLAERVRDAMIGAYTHQDVPFPRLLAELFPDRPVTRTLLSGLCFNMLGYGEAKGAPSLDAAVGGGLELAGIPEEAGVAKQDLAFTCTGRGSSVHVALKAAVDLFTPGRLAELARGFEAVLACAASAPEVTLGQLRQAVRGAALLTASTRM
jgi:non-ribosomal peptide synthetase component F